MHLINKKKRFTNMKRFNTNSFPKIKTVDQREYLGYYPFREAGRA
jgi:hypothetical protein